MVYTISNPYQTLEIDTTGGQVLRWSTLNQNSNLFEDNLYVGSTTKRTGIPLLFPFANPLSNDTFDQSGLKIPQHGFARNSQWTVANQNPERLRLRLSYSNLTPEMQIAYPFNFDLDLTCTLIDENELEYNLEIVNKDAKPLPIAPGLHPYFPIEHSQKNTVHIPEIPEFNSTDFPWNQKLEGTFFTFNKLANIYFPDKIIQIDTSESNLVYENMVVWSQNTENPDSNFICFEPFSKGTNQINENPIIVEPGQILQSKIIFRVFNHTHS